MRSATSCQGLRADSRIADLAGGARRLRVNGTAGRLATSGATLVTATGPMGSGLASSFGFDVVLGGELEDLR
jgi:hypothetical protein